MHRSAVAAAVLLAAVLAGCAAAPPPAPPAATQPPLAEPPTFGFADGAWLRIEGTAGAEVHRFRLHAEQPWSITYIDAGHESAVWEDYGFVLLPAGGTPPTSAGCAAVGPPPFLTSSAGAGIAPQPAGVFDVWYWNRDAEALDIYLGEYTPAGPRVVPRHPTGWSAEWTRQDLAREAPADPLRAQGTLQVPSKGWAHMWARAASGVQGRLAAILGPEGCAGGALEQDAPRGPVVEVGAALGPGSWPWAVSFEGVAADEAPVPGVDNGWDVSVLLLRR